MNKTQRIIALFAASIFILLLSAANAQVALWEMKNSSDSMGGESNLIELGDFETARVSDSNGVFISRWINAANSNGFAAAEGSNFGFGWVPVNAGDELSINSSLTVFARIRFESYNGTDDIIRLADSQTIDNFALELVNGFPHFKVHSGVSESTVVSTVQLFEKTWYDITGVYNATSQTLELYIFSPVSGNMIMLETASAPAFIDAGGDLLFFEDLRGANGINDGALMERAAIWAQALSASDVNALSAVRPTAEMTSSVPPGLTNAPWIPVTVTFSEPVVGFDINDINATNASVLSFNGSSSLTVYSFLLVPIADGIVLAEIAQDSAASVATGLGNKEAIPFSRTFGSLPRPSVILTSEVPPGNTPLSPVHVTAIFSEGVIGFDSVLDLNPSNAIVVNFQGTSGGNTYTFDLLPQVIGGFFGVRVPLEVAVGTATGLGNGASDVFSRTYVRPTVQLSTNAPLGVTSVKPLIIIATFNYPVTGFGESGIQLFNATIDFNPSSSGAVYVFKVFPTDDGLVTIQIPGGVAIALGGVLTNSASLVLSRIYDPDGASYPSKIEDTWTLYE